MPIQINEVVIRTTVDPESGHNVPSGDSGTVMTAPMPDDQTVLEIIEAFLKDKNER